MTGEDVRQVLEAILPPQAIERRCAQFGVIERRRKLHLGMLVRAMISAAGTPGGAYQGDVLRSYLAFEVPRVTRSAFYRWFDEPLEQFMAALADRALAYYYNSASKRASRSADSQRSPYRGGSSRGFITPLATRRGPR